MFLSYVTVLCKGPIERSVIFEVDYKYLNLVTSGDGCTLCLFIIGIFMSGKQHKHGQTHNSNNQNQYSKHDIVKHEFLGDGLKTKQISIGNGLTVGFMWES